MVKDKSVFHYLVGWWLGQFCWSWPGITDVADVTGQLDWGWRNRDVRSPCMVMGSLLCGLSSCRRLAGASSQHDDWVVPRGQKRELQGFWRLKAQKPQLLLSHSIHQSGHKPRTCCWSVLAVTAGVSGIRLRTYWAGGTFSLGLVDRVTVRKARGPQAAWGNKLQVAGVLFLQHKIKSGFFNSVLRTLGSALSYTMPFSYGNVFLKLY